LEDASTDPPIRTRRCQSDACGVASLKCGDSLTHGPGVAAGSARVWERAWQPAMGVAHSAVVRAGLLCRPAHARAEVAQAVLGMVGDLQRVIGLSILAIRQVAPIRAGSPRLSRRPHVPTRQASRRRVGVCLPQATTISRTGPLAATRGNSCSPDPVGAELEMDRERGGRVHGLGDLAGDVVLRRRRIFSLLRSQARA